VRIPYVTGNVDLCKVPSTYNPAKHPSEDNCNYLGKVYNAHDGVCYDKPTPPPQCGKDMYYDNFYNKCMPVKKPPPPPAPPVTPAPPATPVCKSDQYYDEHKKCCVDKPKPTTCPSYMIYDPKTQKCYNPAKHPDEYNCAFLGKLYNAHDNVCYDKPQCKDWEKYDWNKKCCVPKH